MKGISKRSKLALAFIVFLGGFLPLYSFVLQAVQSTFYTEPVIDGFVEITVPREESKGCLYIKYDEKKVTPEYFYKNIVVQQKPVVLKGAALNWPAYNLWTDEYLEKKMGNVIVKAVYTNKTSHFGQRGKQYDKYVTFSEFLKLVNTTSDIYLNIQKGYNPTKEKSKSITKDLDIPTKYLLGDWEPPKVMPYISIVEKRKNPSLQLTMSDFWMGPDGIVSRLHYDPTDNILVMIDGVKKFVVFPPEDSENLYPNIGYQPNFSKVDIDNPDLEAFPNFAKTHRHECIAEKGDFLYLPGRWWHQVYSSGRNVAMNFWYNRENWFSKMILALKLYYGSE